MPRASKPSSDVAALIQSRPVVEYQTVERGAPSPFQSPTIAKPPAHEPTARGM